MSSYFDKFDRDVHRRMKAIERWYMAYFLASLLIVYGSLMLRY